MRKPTEDWQALVDPLLPWEGPFPYTLLGRFGLTPGTSKRDMLDASYDMTEALADPDVSSAWESLRTARERLFVDFFLYRLPSPPPPRERARRALPAPREVLRGLLSEVLEDLRHAPASRGVSLPPHLDDLPPWDAIEEE